MPPSPAKTCAEREEETRKQHEGGEVARAIASLTCPKGLNPDIFNTMMALLEPDLDKRSSVSEILLLRQQHAAETPLYDGVLPENNINASLLSPPASPKTPRQESFLSREMARTQSPWIDWKASDGRVHKIALHFMTSPMDPSPS